MANSPKILTGFPVGKPSVIVATDNSENYTNTESSTTTISTSATEVDTPSLASRIILKNTATATIFIGDDTVTTTTGWPLQQDESLIIDIQPGQATIYAIVAASTETLYVLGLYKV